MTMPGEKPLTVIGRTNENRRASKPLMEKRRRARINHSLAELKTLILDAVKKEQQNTRHSKLEKADILELTVKHLQTLHRQQSMVQAGNNKFTAGFKECAKEVSRFVDKTDDMEPQLRSRLLNHLSRCLVNHQPSNTKNTTSAVIHSETELLQQPEMSRSPASASSYSGDGSYYLERADSAGPDFAGSSPTRPSSSSYQFHNSPSHETASRASTPGSMRSYLLGVNPAMAPDPYDFNNYPPMESEYLERPASPLNLVVGPSKDNQLRDNQPSDPTEPQPKYCPNPDDDSVWRPW